MKSLLVITTLDYQQEANQRIHYVVERFSLSLEKVIVVHFKQCDRRSFIHWLVNSFPFSTKELLKEKVHLISVNPLGNFPENFGKGLLKFPESVPSRGISRGAISRLLNLLGLYKSLSTTLFYLLAYLLKLRKDTFDVVLVEGPWEGLVGCLVKAIGKARALVYQDIDYIPGDLDSKLRSRITERVEFYCMRRADLRISCGSLLKEFRQKRIRKEVLFIPNGANYHQMKRAQKKDPHKPTLVYMGNVIDWTGLHWAIGALPDLLKDIPELKLMIVGRGNPSYVRKLKEMVREARLGESVEFVGFVPYHDLPLYFKRADIGLAAFDPIPLLKYAFPLKVVEYLSAGLPVIASEGTESARIVTEFQCGSIVTYGNSDELKEAVIDLLKDSQKFKVLAENAVKGGKQFSWKELMDIQFKYVRALFPEESTP